MSLEATGSLPSAALRGHAPAPIGGLVLLPGCYDIQSGLLMEDSILESLLCELEAEAEAEAELVRQHKRQSDTFVPRPSASRSHAAEGPPFRSTVPYRMDEKLRKAAEQVPIHIVTSLLMRCADI